MSKKLKNNVKITVETSQGIRTLVRRVQNRLITRGVLDDRDQRILDRYTDHTTWHKRTRSQ